MGGGVWLAYVQRLTGYRLGRAYPNRGQTGSFSDAMQSGPFGVPLGVDMRRPWTPGQIIATSTVLFLALTLATSSSALFGRAMVLNENQILYLFSTSAQVIAAIYGLTLTGFIFFRNELGRREMEDDTLVDAVENLKARYFVLLKFISVLVGATLVLSNLAIAIEGGGATTASTIVINAGQSAFLASLAVIVYFIFDVISPHRIEQASRRLQSSIDPARDEDTQPGSFQDFLRTFNEIERILSQDGQGIESSAAAPDTKPYTRRISNTRRAEILLRNERIDKALYDKLRNLITLRNAIIHGADPIVSQAIVRESTIVRDQLREALGE